MVLIFAENIDGQFKKAAAEALTYGVKTAKLMGLEAVAIAIGNVSETACEALGAYGVSKVMLVNNEKLNQLNTQAYTKIIADVAVKINATYIIMSHNSTGKAVAPRLSARLKAGLVSAAVALPDGEGNITKNVYSGKAFANYTIHSTLKIITVNPNAMPVETATGTASVETIAGEYNAEYHQIKVLESKRQTGVVPLPEAELVVSAGRGMKGPENWGMIEELATILGATTACSRAVSDLDWRPHHEHVGQTGLTIRPNLYIAVGISGAIQHLAGVNASKTIVVINKDPEAPFFKAADYGIVGDAFEVVPKLNEALRAYKAAN
jgi:electron transfer flavoprotein alpha subunit